MTSHGERNDPRRPGVARRSHKAARVGRSTRGASPAEDGAAWIWGRHAVEAALANPRRESLHRLLATADKAKDLQKRLEGAGMRGLQTETLDTGAIARLLPPGAVHQGLALLADPPAAVELADIANPVQGVLVLLDQVADPQNVGAVFRSAAAFGARGVILQDRRAPPLSGALAKASAGGVERVPCVRVVNLSRTLEQLTELGWKAVGLSGTAEIPLSTVLDGSPVVLVLGSEGDGMRRLVSEHCDVLACIPMPGGLESLNIAAAATIALYEASRSRTHTSGANIID